MGTEKNPFELDVLNTESTDINSPGMASSSANKAPSPAGSASLVPSSQSLRAMTSPVLLTILFILLIGGVGFTATKLIVSLKKDPVRVTPDEHVFSVQVFDAHPVDVQELVQGFGAVRAMRKVTLSAQVAGEVVETMQPLKVGQEISAATFVTESDGRSRLTGGEMIARIDPQTYQEKVDQAEDRIREDEAEINRLAQEEKNLARRQLIQKKSVASFQKEYNRVKNLYQQKVVNESDLTTAELDLNRYEETLVSVETEQALIPERKKQIQARIQTHKNDLEIAKLDFNRTTITSPASGQFSEIHIERGQYVKVGDPLVTVINFDRVEIPVGISLEDYLKVAAQIRDQNYPRATIRTNSDSAGMWEGLVTRSSPIADSQTRTVEVFIVVDNQKTKTPLLPGTFVNISIEGPIYKSVIPVPREAILGREVFIAKGNKAEKRTVQKKINIQTLSLINSGLQKGDRVILTNLDILKPDAAINVPAQGTLTLDSELKRLPIPFLKILK